jgi:hypothetical protein
MKVEEKDKVFSFGEGKPYPTKKTLVEKAARCPTATLFNRGRG